MPWFRCPPAGPCARVMAPTSALFLLTLALLQLSSCFAQDHSYQGASVADQTKTALLDWKDHLASQGSIFSNDSRFHSWTNDGSMCRDWVGIYCNLAGDLDILIAIGEDLRGTLPAQLSVATGLTGILLKENSFHGAPPRLLSEAAGYATCLAATLPPRGLPHLPGPLALRADVAGPAPME
mmetsp:Transcript_30435/g.76738  ORF Transcript_30435/g.76738 Transcript_30435/m.76738 type:complete len:181 (-) Transcript_30435:650-1192(-)